MHGARLLVIVIALDGPRAGIDSALVISSPSLIIGTIAISISVCHHRPTIDNSGFATGKQQTGEEEWEGKIRFHTR